MRYADSQLRRQMLFGSDFPLISPDRWLDDLKDARSKPEVHQLILKENGVAALRLE